MPITTVLDPLPDPPSRADPATFPARGDAFMAALVTLRAQINAAITELNALSLGQRSADGTISAPGMAFALDTDTGIRRYLADSLALVGGGADKLIVQPSAVTTVVPFTVAISNPSGIGPEVILNNAGSVIGEESAVTFSGGNTLRARIRQALDGAAKGYFLFQTGLTTLSTQMKVSHIDGAVNYIDVYGSATGGSPVVGANGADTNIQVIVASKGTGNILFNSGGGVQFAVTHTAATSRFLAASGSSGGNASIGVVGGGSIRLAAPVVADTSISLTGAGSGLEVGSTSVANSPYLDFHSSGFFNDYDSRIMGTGGASGASETGNLNAYCSSLFTSGHFAPVADNSRSIGFGTNRWSVVYAATGTINTSDVREKTDIEPLTLGIDFLRELQPVTHRWIAGSNDSKLVDSTTEFEEIERPVKEEFDEPYEEIKVVDGRPCLVVGTRKVMRDVVDMLPIIGPDGQPVMESYSEPGPVLYRPRLHPVTLPVMEEVDEPYEEIEVIDGQPCVVSGTRKVMRAAIELRPLIGADGEPVMEAYSEPARQQFRPKLHPVTRMETVRKPKKVREVTSKPGSRRHAAYLAQDVKAGLDARGIDLGMWTLDDASDPNSRQGLRYEQFVPVLGNALIEADDARLALEQRVAALEGRIAFLEGGAP